MDIFEQATREKLLFNNPRGGTLSIQDLWDLPLQSSTGRANLDSIGMDLARQLKAQGEVASLVDATGESDKTLQLAFDIVKRVIEVRKAERDAAIQKSAKATRKQELLAALADAEHGELRQKTPDQIREMIAAL